MIGMALPEGLVLHFTKRADLETLARSVGVAVERVEVREGRIADVLIFPPPYKDSPVQNEMQEATAGYFAKLCPYQGVSLLSVPPNCLLVVSPPSNLLVFHKSLRQVLDKAKAAPDPAGVALLIKGYDPSSIVLLGREKEAT